MASIPRWLLWSFGTESNWNFDADAVDAFETPDDPDDTEDEQDKDGEAIDDVADVLRTQLACKLEFLSFSNEIRWICSTNALKYKQINAIKCMQMKFEKFTLVLCNRKRGKEKQQHNEIYCSATKRSITNDLLIHWTSIQLRQRKIKTTKKTFHWRFLLSFSTKFRYKSWIMFIFRYFARIRSSIDLMTIRWQK